MDQFFGKSSNKFREYFRNLFEDFLKNWCLFFIKYYHSRKKLMYFFRERDAKMWPGNPKQWVVSTTENSKWILTGGYNWLLVPDEKAGKTTLRDHNFSKFCFFPIIFFSHTCSIWKRDSWALQKTFHQLRRSPWSNLSSKKTIWSDFSMIWYFRTIPAQNKKLWFANYTSRKHCRYVTDIENGSSLSEQCLQDNLVFINEPQENKK